MKKTLLLSLSLLVAISALIPQSTSANSIPSPNIFKFLYSTYKHNTYTSKVIGGTCFIVAGLALWKSAYNEVYGWNFIPHSNIAK